MKTAMILAAGRGERLRPLTWDIPKCLSQVNGLPLLGYHLHKLIENGFKRIVVNHAYLGSQVRNYVSNYHGNGIEILFSPEPVGGYETGGGIRHALPLLGVEPFVAINADILTDFNYASLPRVTAKQAHIILVKKARHLTQGDFGISDAGLAMNTPKDYTYAGIACYHPDMFYQQPVGRYSVAPLLKELADKQCLSAQLYEGKWIDIGSIQGLKTAQTLFQ